MKYLQNIVFGTLVVLTFVLVVSFLSDPWILMQSLYWGR